MATQDWMWKRPLVGVVGFPGLPGSLSHTGHTFEEMEARAVADARAYQEAGFEAIMIQNVADKPVAPRVGPETTAWMGALGRSVRRAVAIPLGVCVLKSDGPAAVAIAQAIGGQFVRVKVWVGAMVGAEGLVSGSALETLEFRRRIGAGNVTVFADVLDRTGVPLGNVGLEETAHEAVWHGCAEGLVVTGKSEAESFDWLTRAKKASPSVPIWVGGSVTVANMAEMLSRCDGAIVATAAKVGGVLMNEVSPERARALAEAARAVRVKLNPDGR